MIVALNSGHQVLRPLEDEIPPKMGKTEEGPLASAAGPGLGNWRDRTTGRLRKPLVLQGCHPDKKGYLIDNEARVN
jgi:hypothetical protein